MSEPSELKAGHAPAVKAGGMRVVTKHKPSEKPDVDAYDQKYVDQLPNQSTIAAPSFAPVVQNKSHQDQVSVDALKVTCNKPQPTVEKPHPQAKAKQINQPRK